MFCVFILQMFYFEESQKCILVKVRSNAQDLGDLARLTGDEAGTLGVNRRGETMRGVLGDGGKCE